MSLTQPLNERNNGLYWHDWSRSSIEAWIEVILHGIICLLSLVLLFLYFWVFCINPKKDEQNASGIIRNSAKSRKAREFVVNLRILLLLAILSTILYNFDMYFGNILMVLVFNIRFICLYRTICVLICGLQRTITYLFMLIRFDRAFKGSLFSITKLKLRILIISILSVYTLLSGTMIYAAYLVHGFACDINESLFLFILIFIVPFTDISICVVLTYMFVWRLRELTKIQSKDSITLHMKKIARKLTILTIVMVISTLIATIAASLILFPYQMYGLDLIINCSCLMLSFSILDSQYKTLCGCCISISKICRVNQTSNDTPELQLHNVPSNTDSISRINDAIKTEKESKTCPCIFLRI